MFCFDHPFKDTCEPPDLGFNINIGWGKWAGISTNGTVLCIKIGVGWGLLPIDISIALTSVQP